jgi:hypothetical protein
MAVWTDDNKWRIRGFNSGLTRARLASHLFKTGDGLTTTPEAIRVVKILIEEGLLGQEFDAACPQGKKFRSMGVATKAAAFALRDRERAKVVAATKKRFGVDIDADDFDIKAALEIIEGKLK